MNADLMQAQHLAGEAPPPAASRVFQALGQLMAAVGEHLAALCDDYMRQTGSATQLYTSMTCWSMPMTVGA